jgi:hypothetical protein
MQRKTEAAAPDNRKINNYFFYENFSENSFHIPKCDG